MNDLQWLKSKGYKLSEDEKYSFCERVGMKIDSLNWDGYITEVRIQSIREIIENREDRKNE